MKLISLGCNCEVRNFLNRFNYSTGTYPFDWIWSNITFVIDSFNNDYCVFTEVDKLHAIHTDLHTYIHSTKLTEPINQLKCTAISVHDADHTTAADFPDKIPEINSRYTRRFNRLYEALHSNEKILLIRKVIPKDQEAVEHIDDTFEHYVALLNILTTKFNSDITLCVISDNMVSNNSRIRIFGSFYELSAYINSIKAQT